MARASVEVESEASAAELVEESTAVLEQETVPAAETTPAVERRRRPAVVKRRNITVPTEELEIGKEYTGRVRSVQSFGAFVDFGAFTDGLVHISELTNGFVAKVEDVVTVGAEVTVRVKFVDVTKSRIALTMRDREAEQAAAAASGETSESRPRRSRSSADDGRDDTSEGGRPARKIAGRGRRTSRDDQKVNHNFKKGQEVKGIVKNLTSYGCFIDLGNGVEGLLHNAESSGNTLNTGEEVEVKILKVEKNRISLTMRKEVDLSAFNESLSGNKVEAESSIAGKALNPFVLAFRRANLIPETFENEVSEVDDFTAEVENVTSAEDTLEGQTKEVVLEEVEVEGVEAEAAAEEKVIAEGVVEAEVKAEEAIEEVVKAEVAIEEEANSEDAAEVKAEGASVEEIKAEEVVEETKVEAAINEEVKVEEVVEEVEVEEIKVEATIQEEVKAEELTEVVIPEEVKAEAPSDEEVIAEKVVEAVSEKAEAEKDEDVTKTTPENKAVGDVEEVTEVKDTVVDVVEAAASEAVKSETIAVEEVQAVAEDVPSAPLEPTSAKTGISAALVKKLREETGAGMMACKKALTDAEGDVDKAREVLRQKGLASADKKASRVAAEGLVSSYVHSDRIGVLIEVNCETDFVARGEAFKALVEDLGMQVVASPQVEVIQAEDIPQDVVERERELEMQKEDLASKPEAVRSKIVDGRLGKRLKELALLDQPYIKNDKITVKDLVKETIAALGENIQIRRFTRFNLGEGIQKKSGDFAAEVAAATQVSAPPAPAPVAEASPSDVPKVAVSAALVKELREATGAGMMDCKKALAANENDLEKARNYLRKKGLASADKKASRIASEGIIGSYIHDGRIGAIVEVNCETDFVARGQKFRELVEDLAMQTVACPLVQYVSTEDIDPAFIAKEREIEMGKEDLASKPEAVREKIVDGRIKKRLGELALLEQPYIKNDKLLIKDLVKEAIAALGENIQVRRFERFTLGEGIEKKVSDFAAEVAAASVA